MSTSLPFDPIIFGNPDYINAQRFKDSLAKPGTKVIIWNSQDRRYRKLGLAASINNPLPPMILPRSTPPCFLHTHLCHARIDDIKGRPAVGQIIAGDGIYFDNLNFSPVDADFIEVTLSCLEAPDSRLLALKCS